MLTSLDRDESPNFFSHSRIKLFKIEYREMTLATVHLTLHTVHAVNDAKCVIAQPWTVTAIWAPQDRW